jgi:hypothetical protein
MMPRALKLAGGSLVCHVTDMLLHMRTTVEISDSLFSRVRRTMRKRNTTLRALVEEGLARVVADSPAQGERPHRAVFAGEPGLVPPLHPEQLPELLRRLRQTGQDEDR